MLSYLDLVVALHLFGVAVSSPSVHITRANNVVDFQYVVAAQWNLNDSWCTWSKHTI